MADGEEAGAVVERECARAEVPVIIARSPALQLAMHVIERVRDFDVPVVILGPTGSGKELLALLLHRKSIRAGTGSLIVDNCAGPENSTFLESRYLGFEKGSFTGAFKSQRGLIEQAHRGTLFLDEAQDMPRPLQKLLLRAIEKKEIFRIGSEEPIVSDFRLVLAVSRDLALGVEEGTIRSDFYYRVKLVTVVIPPLSERPEDISPLLSYFAGHFARKYRQPAFSLSPSALDALLHSTWPGNVRQLAHEVERLQIFHAGKEVNREDLDREVLERRTKESVTRRMRKEITLKALREADGDVEKAAQALHVNPTTVRRRLQGE